MNARLQAPLSDDDIAWLTERVRYYIRKGINTVYAIDRAKADLRKLPQCRHSTG